SRRIAVQPAGATTPRNVPVPPWYVSLFEIGSWPDGSKVWVIGWSAPAGDSIGVSVLSMPDAKDGQWHSVFGEGASGIWSADGSLLLGLRTTSDSYAIERLRGPGQVEQLGAIPRSLQQISLTPDQKRVSIVTRDAHADAWTMRIVKK